MIHREDFEEVTPTPDELDEWKRKHPQNPNPSVPRAVHLPCGKRMWYSGIGIGAHMRSCHVHWVTES